MSEWKVWRKPPDYQEPPQLPPLGSIPLNEAWDDATRTALLLEDAFSAYFGIDFYTTALGQPQEDVFV